MAPSGLDPDTGHRKAGNRVCVVGTGGGGLVAIKNLVEQGLQVTAFERNDYVGGMWHNSQDPQQTTAMPGTRTIVSKDSYSFSDYPNPRDYPSHPSAADVQRYLEAYARHFELLEHIHFSTAVVGVDRDESDSTWLVQVENTKTSERDMEKFDRVVMATGFAGAKIQPKVKGIERFAGDVVHSREFKDPGRYRGKNVLVMGLGQTAADALQFLDKEGAGKLYLSHRHRVAVLPRVVRGYSWDHYLTRRVQGIIRFAAKSSESAYPFLQGHPFRSGPRVLYGPLHRAPLFSDLLPYQLRDGKVESKPGVREITGPRSVTFTDGTKVDDVDAIILCSGYLVDFSSIDGAGSPTDPALAPDGFQRLRDAPFADEGSQFPRLYHGLLSERYPGSLAFLGPCVVGVGLLATYDLETMALASVWTGSYPLPSKEAIKKEIDSTYDCLVRSMERGPMPPGYLRLNSKKPYDWLNRAAGTGVLESIEGWGWQAWKFWWANRRLHRMIMDGVDSPAVYRLLDTGRGRKPWKGAREAIEKANAQAGEMHLAWKKAGAKGD